MEAWWFVDGDAGEEVATATGRRRATSRLDEAGLLMEAVAADVATLRRYRSWQSREVPSFGNRGARCATPLNADPLDRSGP